MKLLKYVATLGPIGYLKGSGTLASLITVLCIWWARPCLLYGYPFILLGVGLLSYYAIKAALSSFPSSHDPREIVIDEVLGCFVTFLAIPLTAPNMFIGFLLFRFFDIVKPLGIAKLEYIKGAWGILADDVVAGIFSNLIVQGIGYLCIH